MDLLASLNTLSNTDILNGPRCTVSIALGKMTDDEQKALVAVIDNPDIAATLISNALISNGHTVKSDAVRRHRKRGLAEGCRCSR